MRELFRFVRVLLAVLPMVALTAAGCSPRGGDKASEGASEGALARARAAADELGGGLAAELSVQLAMATPATAIDVCSEIAPARTAEISRHGLTIRRTSRRHRNPANAPDDWERSWLERYEEMVAAGEQPGEIHEIDAASGDLRYLRPIMVGAACLLCHGAEAQLDPEVRRRLAARYPEDRATGFAEGDLRGAFSVRVRLDQG